MTTDETHTLREATEGLRRVLVSAAEHVRTAIGQVEKTRNVLIACRHAESLASSNYFLAREEFEGAEFALIEIASGRSKEERWDLLTSPENS